MAIACDNCGATTDIPEAFVTQRVSFRRRVRTECPRCHAESLLRAGRRSLWTFAWLGPIGLLWVLVFPERWSGWALLNLCFAHVFLIAAIVPHELGHAFVARWLGYRVFRIYVGDYGKTVFTRNLFGFPTEFRAIPLGGFTVATPTDTNRLRLKELAFILAGPLANCLLCAVALLFVPFHEAWDFGRLGRALVPGQVFLYANLFVVLDNLWPQTFDTPAGRFDSDGKLLWSTLFTKRETIDNLLAARFALEAMECHRKNQSAEALTWIEQGLTRYPDNVPLLNWRGLLLIESTNYEAARDCFTTLLSREGQPPGFRPLMLNNIAYVDALLGGTDRLAEADRYSQEALSALGWIPAVKGTRGTTLLELGRIEEALVLLRESMQQSEEPGGKAQNACAISIGEARRGNLAESRKYLDEAKQLAPKCFLLERAEEALRQAERATKCDILR